MKPMLASDADLGKLTFPIIASPKLDGIRGLVHEGKLLSRSLKLIPNQFLQMWFGHTKLNGFDGELIMGEPTSKTVYRDTVSVAMSDEKPAVGIKFYVFDLFDCPDAGYMLRRKKLEQMVFRVTDRFPNIILLEQEWIKDRAKLDAYEQKMLDLGYEGLILRDPGGVYKYGRSTAKEGILLKLKRFSDAEAVIIGVEEQMHNTNEATTNELGRTKRSTAKAGLVGKDTTGALVVRDVETGVIFNIGTGFDDHTKQTIWDNRATLIAQKTVVKYKSFKIGVKDAPRHPVFLGFRDRRDM